MSVRTFGLLGRVFDPLDAKSLAVWESARPIPGRNAHYVRLDDFGNEIHRLAYGDSLSPYGWRVDNAKPSVPGRSGAVAYLQPADGGQHLSLTSVLAGLFRSRRSSA